MIDFKYKPDGDVLKAFMKDDTFFRGVRGPVGSGKSVGCCVEVFRRAKADGLLFVIPTHSLEQPLLKLGLIGFQKMIGASLLGLCRTPITLKRVTWILKLSSLL